MDKIKKPEGYKNFNSWTLMQQDIAGNFVPYTFPNQDAEEVDANNRSKKTTDSANNSSKKSKQARFGN